MTIVEKLIEEEELRLDEAQELLKEACQVTVHITFGGRSVNLPLRTSSAGRTVAELAICYREKVLEDFKVVISISNSLLSYKRGDISEET